MTDETSLTNNMATKNSMLNHSQVDGEANNLHSPSNPEPTLRAQKLNIWKNFIVLCLGIYLLHVAYYTFYFLQSSLHSEKGLGTISLAVDYVAQVVSCFFIPTLMMKRLGTKWTLVISMAEYMMFFLANFYAKFYTLLPTAAILGIGMGTLWASMGTYVTSLAYSYAAVLNEEESHKIIAKFFGIFYTSLKAAIFSGSLIASAVLQRPNLPENATVPAHCGFNYCNEPLTRSQMLTINSTDEFGNITSNLTTTIVAQSTDKTQVYIMCGVFVGVSLIGLLLIAFFLEPLKENLKKKEGENLTITHLLFATFRLLKNRNQQFLVVAGISLGILQSFFAGEYLKAYVTCSVGLYYATLCTVTFGVGVSGGAALCGLLAKYVGRVPLMIVGAVTFGADIIALLYWTPNPDQTAIFLVIAGVYGAAQATYLTQISALYGVIFPNDKEPAFTNYRLWECVGLVMGFAWSTVLCMVVKLTILLVALVLGIIAYGIVEVRFWRQQRWQNNK